MGAEWPFYLAGEWARSELVLDSVNPYDGSLVGRTFLASAEQRDQAVAAAVRAFEETRRMAAYEREAALLAIAAAVDNRRDDLARLIAQECGKPLRDASAEAARASFTFRVAAEEAKRIGGGEVIPLDWVASSRGRIGLTRRFPIGPVAGISPFNFPLNLAIHKIAPAIAAGNPIVLKPPSEAPLTMLMMAGIIHDLSVLPKGALSVLPMSRAIGDRLVTDERLRLLTFTGSPAVGWDMKRRAGDKRVVLELGGNAGVVVDEGADISYAAKRCTFGGFVYAGQVCISVQRIFAHRAIHDRFRDELVDAVRAIKVGDPLDPATEMGPLISDRAATRVANWLEEAKTAGAKVLTGGRIDGRMMEPTVLAEVPPSCSISCQEAFAPVVTLDPVDSFEAGLARVNDSRYGLQAGVFTDRLEHTLRAFETLEVGGVVVNDVPTYRVDHMPYGGVKQSGFGREGIRYALEDHTELRLLAINRPGTIGA